MAEMLNVAYEVITPMLLCAAVGIWFGRKFKPDPRMISRMNLYVLTPSLAYVGMAQAEIEISDLGRMAGVVFGVAGVLGVVSWMLAKQQRSLPPTTQSAFVLTTILVNAGNFGIPFSEFAFGEEGKQMAVIVVALTVIVTNTLGIYVASSGTATIWQGIRNIFSVPLPYAITAGFIVNFGHVTPPVPIARSVYIFSQGSVPVILILLGVQLSQMSIQEQTWARIRAIGLAAGTRLMIAPLIALALTALLGINGLPRDVLILQLSMPTAVNAAILSNEFGSDISFVAPTILVTTLASVITLSLLMVTVI
jgi:predicted permease